MDNRTTTRLHRAQGCLMGQLCGDALGSLVEFQSPEQIRGRYPEGVRLMHDGGTWNSLAGQPTDDSEMALMLARSLALRGEYSAEAVRESYVGWLNSEPFDCGATVAQGLRGTPNSSSQANGALMRVAPLGIFGALRDPDTLDAWAREDAGLTHPHPVCVQANLLYVRGIAHAIRQPMDGSGLYALILAWAKDMAVEPTLLACITAAKDDPPADYLHHQGWVLIALQNTLWQLLHAPKLEEALVDTVMRGGDTDTNAAICGALLGALYGLHALPSQWVGSVLACQPAPGKPGVLHPRPERFWPGDALELATKLLGPPASSSFASFD